MGFVRLRAGGTDVCVTNLHASAGDPVAAERELMVPHRKSERLLRLSGHAPIEVSFGAPVGNRGQVP